MNYKQQRIRFFTISDYEEEEKWLREQHKAGWKLLNFVLPCFYTFEKCEPDDVVYRLDFKNQKPDDDYEQLFSDYGWELFHECMGWMYFRKKYSEIENEYEYEIFSDPESKIAMIDHIYRTRMLPIVIIYLCFVIPQWIIAVERPGEVIFKFVFSILFIIWVILVIHCGIKLGRLKNKYRIMQK